ncbi:tyrosine-type recombinase/integrase [Streptomyces sp. NPDC049541]|uniref:tyrosine-type recombinase/integrase n=1 Tax=Streptomyces sp. NPDC049541 TaxID=3365594 RepID=UPI003799FB5B
MLDGPPVTASLLFTGSAGLALDRNRFNDRVWRPTLRAADVETGRDNGMHALRHFYASVLLDAGESIKALSEYLGHHDPGFTLRTYTHLMPSSEARTKAAVDRVFQDDEPATAPTRPRKVPRPLTCGYLSSRSPASTTGHRTRSAHRRPAS